MRGKEEGGCYSTFPEGRNALLLPPSDPAVTHSPAQTLLGTISASHFSFFHSTDSTSPTTRQPWTTMLPPLLLPNLPLLFSLVLSQRSGNYEGIPKPLRFLHRHPHFDRLSCSFSHSVCFITASQSLLIYGILLPLLFCPAAKPPGFSLRPIKFASVSLSVCPMSIPRSCIHEFGTD